ncbi:MAG: adenylyl-sulfate kinase [Planctomycetales bacterium]|nr:adenylyl-sulfate kinase [Planctomycetales bacterium]
MPGAVVWFTGRAGSGKSTIARLVEARLREASVPAEVLDSDELRKLLAPDLGYSPADRDLNTKRLAWFSATLARHGVVAMVCAVSPLRAHRDRARAMAPRFVEAYCRCPEAELRRRDPKGLYARADRGEVRDVAGLHQPYEEPERAELVLDTDREPAEASARRVLLVLERLGIVPAGSPYTPDEERAVAERLSALGYG